MTKNFLAISFFISFALSQGCSIHAPDDGSDLGPEVSVDAINQVLSQAQSGAVQSQVFHVGDAGTIQIIDTVMDSYAIRETDNYQVTSIDNQNINYSLQQVDTNSCYVGQIPLDNSAVASPTPAPTQTPQKISFVKKWIAPVTKPMVRVAALIKRTISHFLSRVTVEPSTALGEAHLKQQRIPVVDSRLKIATHKLNSHIMVSAASNSVTANDTLSGPVPCGTQTNSSTPMDSPTPSSSPAPSPTPDDGSDDNVTHQYFKLVSYAHRFVTPNCAQLSNCQVDATHVEYDEVQTDSSGNATRIHWTYEISIEVPGLFFILQQCFSNLVVQDGQVLPLTRCQNVSNFTYGSPPQ